MALAINANTASLNAQYNLGKTQEALQNSHARLSSGLRLQTERPQGADTVTPVGSNNNVPSTSVVLKISPEAMALSRQDAASSAREANELISTAQTADAALDEVSSVLQRALELTTQRESGSLSDDASQKVQTELASLSNEVNRMAQTTTGINGQKLLDGSYQGQSAAVNGTRMSVSALPNVAELTGTRNGSLESSASIKKALEAVNGVRAGLSSPQAQQTPAAPAAPTPAAAGNQSSQPASLAVATAPATPAPRARTDEAASASETAALTKAQILQQAGSAILSQANSLSNHAISLLRG